MCEFVERKRNKLGKHAKRATNLNVVKVVPSGTAFFIVTYQEFSYNCFVRIEEIRQLCKDDTIELSQHFLERCAKRGITYSEAKETILNGKIIEEYPNDFPFPSCLILGVAKKKRVLHIVVGIGNDKLWFITIYEPSAEKWSEDFSKRIDEKGATK